MKMQEELYSIFNLNTEYHWWFIGRRKIILSIAKKLLAGDRNARILDIGCGAGATLKQLERLGIATGIDISPEALDFSRKRGCRRLCLVGEEKLPLADNTIDLIVSSDVLEHLEHDYRHLREYRRVLTEGGSLVITVPALAWLWSNHDRANRHWRRYSRTGLRDLLGEEGWEIEKLSYFCTFLFPLILVIKVISRAVTGAIKDYNPAWNFKIPGLGINCIFSRIFGWESSWLLSRDFPIGSSLLAVCRKKL